MACERGDRWAIAAEGKCCSVGVTCRSTTTASAKGVKAIDPVIRQIFHRSRIQDMDQDALERKLYIIRKSSGHAIGSAGEAATERSSTCRRCRRARLFKGMLLADQVGTFYLDLQDPMLVSALAMVHQRSRPATFPTRDLAASVPRGLPQREINTLRGTLQPDSRPQAPSHPRCW